MSAAGKSASIHPLGWLLPTCAFLFIAEAMAFAVLSVVLGYLVAQAAAKLFAGTALWSGDHRQLLLAGLGVAAMVAGYSGGVDLCHLPFLAWLPILPFRMSIVPGACPTAKQSQLDITLPFSGQTGRTEKSGGIPAEPFHQPPGRFPWTFLDR